MKATFFALTKADREALNEALTALSVLLKHMDVLSDEVGSEYARAAMREVKRLVQDAADDSAAEIKAALHDLGEA